MNTTMTAKVEALVLSSYESMYRLAYSYVRNQDDAMDIVQESIYKAIKCADSVRRSKNLKTWLWRIVINTSIDFIRKSRQEYACQNLPEAATEDTYTDFDTIEALDVLNEKERAIIILRFFEDRKLQEIADILGLSSGTVKSILYRSLKKLKIEFIKGDLQYEG